VRICVIGDFEAAFAGRLPRDWLHGEWSEPPALAHVRGLIGRVGIPRWLQAVIYDEKLQLQLIGFDTEDEIMSTASSLRRASLEPSVTLSQVPADEHALPQCPQTGREFVAAASVVQNPGTEVAPHAGGDAEDGLQCVDCSYERVARSRGDARAGAGGAVPCSGRGG
jgi:hypothetical protein